MVNFKDLFKFSQKEVSRLFEKAELKSLWRGLKLLQAPLVCLGPSESDGTSTQNVCPQHGKILIVTPASCGKAHQRNKFRRRIKNIFYTKKLYLYPIESVLIARKGAMDLDEGQLEKFLIKTLTPVDDISSTTQ